MAAYPQAATFPFVPPTIPGLGNASGFALRAARRFRSHRQRARDRADKVVAEARKQPEITAVNNTMRTSIPLLAA